MAGQQGVKLLNNIPINLTATLPFIKYHYSLFIIYSKMNGKKNRLICCFVESGIHNVRENEETYIN